MEKEISDRLITDAAKTIFSYCKSRTNSKEEAEDLSQDIILELLKARENLRDDKAFYGFMWAVAGNVYKDWCKKRRKIFDGELDESISDNSIPLAELIEKESDLTLLYRELSLLTEQYRKVIVMYYFNDIKVSEISKSLNISESMVKFLLFKSRKILKEGMNMERKQGDLSFNPGNLALAVLKGGENFNLEDVHSLHNLVNDNLIVQNILIACYNDRCTAEEISLQIGVAVPYLEKDLGKLCEKDLLIKKGGKYETNIIIFTKEFSEEAYQKTLLAQREIAEVISKYITSHLNDIKAIGFYRGIEDDNLLKWLIAEIIIGISRAKYEVSVINSVSEKKHDDIEAFIWGYEPWTGQTGGSVGIDLTNANGDMITCIDFLVGGNTEADSFYFDRYQNRVNIILDIAKGKIDGFSENDMVEIAEFINRGFAEKSGDTLTLRFPVFTKEQFEKLISLLDDTISVIAEKMRGLVDITTDILIQHTPVSMKKEAKDISWVKARESSVVPVKIMADNATLQQISPKSHPATFIVLA